MRRLNAHRLLGSELRKSEARYRTVLDAAFDAIVTITPEGIVRWFNRGAERIFGHTAEEIIGQPVTLLMPERYREHCLTGLHRYLRTGEARVVGSTIELVGLRKDGSEFPIEMSLGESQEDGERLFTGVMRDVTERKEGEKAIKESEERFRSLVQNTSEIITILEADGTIRYVSPAVERVIGYKPEEQVGINAFASVHPEDREQASNTFAEILKRPGLHPPLEFRVPHKDGSWRYLEHVVNNLVDDPSVSGVVITSRDVTGRKEVDRKLREAEQRYRTLVEQVPAVVYIQEIGSPDSAIYMSPQIETLTGYSPEDCKDPDLRWGMVHPDDREWLQAEDERTGEPGEVFATEYRVVHRDGRIKWVRNESVMIEDEMSGTRYWQGLMLDITERKALEQQLHHQAFYDPLTGLPNRALFMERLEHASTRANQRNGRVAMLFVDLDNFKVINDSLGHKAGDQLLKAVAERMKSYLRPEDTAARLGGDEFTILVEDVAGVGEGVRIAERIADVLQPPFTLEEQEVFITTSIGIALNNSTQERAENLLRYADLAMYRAKHKGKARCEVFEPSMSTDALERLRLENELRQGVERGEFKVYYQPILKLDTGRIAGAEALVRWEHPRRGLLLPEAFLSVAEDTGLIVQIGEGVLREACYQMRAWQQRYRTLPPLTVSVNLSPRQLFRPELVEEILAETEIDPGSLQLEITEGIMTSNGVHSTNNTLRSLKNLNIRLAVDDFGMGYSSLSYLKRFPVDQLKIDRSFIAGSGQDTDGALTDPEIVSAMIDLTHALGLEAVAEGVETADQLAQLRKMKCDLAQGNYLSKPLPSAALSALLAEDLTGQG
jgi:diguanylate cyclase (GGDEF)-like protein/PAS domain S-box-containing protein